MQELPCPLAQCASSDPKTLHSGYVTHRSRGEEACERSTGGHNEYMRLQRLNRAAERAKRVSP